MTLLNHPNAYVGFLIEHCAYYAVVTVNFGNVHGDNFVIDQRLERPCGLPM